MKSIDTNTAFAFSRWFADDGLMTPIHFRHYTLVFDRYGTTVLRRITVAFTFTSTSEIKLGFAVCNPCDQYSKNLGRRIAVGRLLCPRSVRVIELEKEKEKIEHEELKRILTYILNKQLRNLKMSEFKVSKHTPTPRELPLGHSLYSPPPRLRTGVSLLLLFLLALIAFSALALECRTTTILTADGRLVTCTTCCDQTGNCNVTCF